MRRRCPLPVVIYVLTLFITLGIAITAPWYTGTYRDMFPFSQNWQPMGKGFVVSKETHSEYSYARRGYWTNRKIWRDYLVYRFYWPYTSKTDESLIKIGTCFSANNINRCEQNSVVEIVSYRNDPTLVKIRGTNSTYQGPGVFYAVCAFVFVMFCFVPVLVKYSKKNNHPRSSAFP